MSDGNGDARARDARARDARARAQAPDETVMRQPEEAVTAARAAGATHASTETAPRTGGGGAPESAAASTNGHSAANGRSGQPSSQQRPISDGAPPAGPAQQPFTARSQPLTAPSGTPDGRQLAPQPGRTAPGLDARHGPDTRQGLDTRQGTENRQAPDHRQMPAQLVPPSGPVGAAPAAATTAALPAVREGAVPATTAAGAPAAAAVRPKPVARRTRKARLRLSRLDPWSVMKTGFLFSIAAGIVMVVAIYVVWTVVGSSGLFTSVNSTVQSVLGTPGDTTPFRLEDYLSTQKVVGFAAVLASVDVVIFTALATLASFLYNLAATMLGGLEITLAED